MTSQDFVTQLDLLLEETFISIESAFLTDDFVNLANKSLSMIRIVEDDPTRREGHVNSADAT